MTSVAIAGASGLVGNRVVQHVLRRDDLNQVIAVGRRPLTITHDKLVSRAVDFANGQELATAIPEAISVAFCCLGSTMKQAGSREAFRAIDHDAVLAFAEAALARGARRFLLVSSIGANARSGNFYQRTKGQAEESLTQLGFEQLTILRPSLIDDQGARREYRAAERLILPAARIVFGVLGRTRRYAPISAEVIARAMVSLAFDRATERVRIVESEQLHVMAVG
jgi:uncharacterized protein YbjT (DUF2867 family)